MILQFGKHKDKEIDDVPTGYLIWLLKQKICTSITKKEIRKSLKSRKIGPRDPANYFSAGKFKGKYKRNYDTKFLLVYYNTTPDIHPILKQEIFEVIQGRKKETYLDLEDKTNRLTPPWLDTSET